MNMNNEKEMIGFGKRLPGPMTSGKNFEKNAAIKKTGKGASPDFIDLMNIKGIDSTTLENYLSTRTMENGKYVFSDKDKTEWSNILANLNKSIDQKKRQDSIMHLWDKYNFLIKKSKADLVTMTSGYDTVIESSIMDDYESECFETFMHALSIIDVPRMAHMKGSWTFWYTLRGYLVSRNNQIIHTHLNKIKNEKSEWFDSDGKEVSRFDTLSENSLAVSTTEKDFIKSEESKVLNEAIPRAIKKFNDLQKKIWNMKEKGIKKTNIAKSLDVNAKVITDNLKAMKLMLNREIRESGKAHNISLCI